jgi:uncharacterized protein (UPF0333 family)
VQYLVLCCRTANFPSDFGKIDQLIVNTGSNNQGDVMEFVVILVVVVAVGALIYFNRSARSLDVNQDGRVDAADAVAAMTTAAEGVKSTVKKAVVRAKTAGKSAAPKSTAKKPVVRKTRSPKK